MPGPTTSETLPPPQGDPVSALPPAELIALDEQVARDALQEPIFEHGSVQLPQIQEVQAGYKHVRASERRISRKAVTWALAAANVLGVAGAGSEVTYALDHRIEASHGIGERNVDPISEVVSDVVKSDFERAISVDTCNTKVTVDDATNMYQRLFTTHEAPYLTLDNLTTRTQQVTDKLAQDRAEQGFIALPDSFANLQDDAETSRQIPVAEYEAVATEYFPQYGVTALFDWDKSDPKYADMQQAIDDVDNGMVPLDAATLDSNKVIRRRIVDAMASFANLPPSMIRGEGLRDAPVQVVAFGATRDPNALGLSYMDTSGTILLDAGAEAAVEDLDFYGNQAYEATTNDHETAHHLYAMICGTIIQKNAAHGTVSFETNFDPEDPAFDSLNESFTYGTESVNTLNTGMPVQLQYVSHTSTNPGEVVVADAYGATNHDEDWATSLGESVLYAPATAQLLSDRRDTKILDEKIALELARVAKNNPAAAEYLVDRVVAARLQNTVVEQATPHYDALQDYVSKQVSTGIVDMTHDTEYQRLLAARRPYDDLTGQLIKATSNIQ